MAKTKPELVKQEYQGLIKAGRDPRESITTALINIGAKVGKELEAGKPFSPQTQLLIRDERDVKRDVKRDEHLLNILDRVNPANPLSLQQIAKECSERTGRKVGRETIASSLALLLQAERLEDKYVLRRISFEELEEDEEIKRCADENEPRTAEQALSLIAGVLSKRRFTAGSRTTDKLQLV